MKLRDPLHSASPPIPLRGLVSLVPVVPVMASLLCVCQDGWGARQKDHRREVCLEIRPCLCVS